MLVQCIQGPVADAEAAREGERRDAEAGDELADRMRALHTAPPPFLDLPSHWLRTA